LREGFFHATVAKDAKVRKREVVRGGLFVLCVRGFFTPRVVRGIFFHATVAKDAKVGKI
jgi:hypothetical protein